MEGFEVRKFVEIPSFVKIFNFNVLHQDVYHLMEDMFVQQVVI